MTPLEHYDRFHHSYLKHFPDGVLHSSKPKDVTPMLMNIAYLTNMFRKKVLDCGSGLGFPAYLFATEFQNDVTAINTCQKQIDHAVEHYGKAAHYMKHDFDELRDLEATGFDITLFLESIGHSTDLGYLFRSLHDKTNEIFIKHVLPLDESQVDFFEDHYGYKAYSFNEIVREALSSGFELKSFGTLFFEPEKNVDFALEIGSPLIEIECKYIYLEKGAL